MRDSYRDSKHFARLEADCTHRIATYDRKLGDGSVRPDRIPRVLERRIDAAVARFLARYSAGIELALLRPECAWLLAEALSVEVGVRNALDLAAASTLLGFDAVKVRAALYDYWLVDGLRYGVLDWMLGDDIRGEDPSSFWDLSHEYCPATWKLFDAANDRTLGIEEIPHYLDTGWLTDRFEPGYVWHETDYYTGYWCFEAVIASIRAGLDSSAITHPFWPQDLVASYYSPAEPAPVADRSFDDPLLGHTGD